MGQELLTASILLGLGIVGMALPDRWYPKRSRRYFAPVIPRALGMIFVLIGLLSGIAVYVQPMAHGTEPLETISNTEAGTQAR